MGKRDKEIVGLGEEKDYLISQADPGKSRPVQQSTEQVSDTTTKPVRQQLESHFSATRQSQQGLASFE